MSAVLLDDLENTTNIKVYAILGKLGLPKVSFKAIFRKMCYHESSSIAKREIKYKKF